MRANPPLVELENHILYHNEMQWADSTGPNLLTISVIRVHLLSHVR